MDKKNFIKTYTIGYLSHENALLHFDIIHSLYMENNPLGAALLGYCYENGIGVEKNLHKAFDLYVFATSRKHPLGQAFLGNYYENVEKNLNKAVELYELSAAQNHPLGQAYLGIVYSSSPYNIDLCGGRYCVDMEPAIDLLKLSAAQNHPLGQVYLGRSYEKNPNGPYADCYCCSDVEKCLEKDIDTAFQLYKLAVAQNYPLGSSTASVVE